ncbi:MAG: hypothetical protein LBV80_05380 [Deltaproteobacteria bacterium]|jgi:ubiquinone biosynthesis protein UbiJ|nr:hypothetical protein [Deltaproteobacteria bacterium]
MLRFDDSKKLEKAFGEEAAATLVHVLEKMSEDSKRELATKADLENGLTAVRSDMEKLELRMEKMELRLKHDLTLRLGAMMAAAIAIVAALVKLL